MAKAMRARGSGTGSVPTLELLDALGKIEQHDRRLDRLFRLSEAARRRLNCWRRLAVVSWGLAFLFGLALWRALQRCPCDFPLNPLEGQGRNGRVGL